MAGPRGRQFGNDLRRISCHLLDNRSFDLREVEPPGTQNHNALLTIGPRRKGEHGLEGLAADHEGVDASDELIVAVRFAAIRWKEVQITVGPRNETIDAGADEDRNRHRGPPA